MAASQDEIRELILSEMPQLGRASKLEDGYFRYQKSLGPEAKAKTVAAIYFRGVGTNLLEFAFDIEALAECLAVNQSAAQAWLQEMRLITSEETHQNPRYAYFRIGIKNMNQLESFLTEWGVFSSHRVAAPRSSAPDADFVLVPFYVEEDGERTFFLPKLKTASGYRIGPKGNEIVITDYWEALLALSQMSPPRFRRKNQQGNLGIVTCAEGDFEEVKKAYLINELLDEH